MEVKVGRGKQGTSPGLDYEQAPEFPPSPPGLFTMAFSATGTALHPALYLGVGVKWCPLLSFSYGRCNPTLSSIIGRAEGQGMNGAPSSSSQVAHAMELLYQTISLCCWCPSSVASATAAVAATPIATMFPARSLGRLSLSSSALALLYTYPKC